MDNWLPKFAMLDYTIQRIV